MTDAKFNKKLKKIQDKNLEFLQQEILNKEKSKYKCKNPPSTSKLILLVAAILCFQIVLFCECLMWKTGDLSSMYVLVGIPASLIPVIISYYHKAKAENTVGGITYETVIEKIKHPNTLESNGLCDCDDSEIEIKG